MLQFVTAAARDSGQAGRTMPARPSKPARSATPRLAALLAGLACLAPASASTGIERSWQFDVLLDDEPIGQHRFELSRGADGHERVSSAANFDVRFLGIRLYRYRHEATEQWRNGCLVRLESSTSDNGREVQVSGAQGPDGFLVQRNAGMQPQGECVSSYAYWDPARLLKQRALLNPQTGEYEAVRFEYLGEERLKFDSRVQTARRHRLIAAGQSIDLWYAPDGQWLQLESQVRGGRSLRYRLRTSD